MASDSVRVTPILVGPEIYPENPSYVLPSGIKTKDQKAKYWLDNSIEDFNNFFASSNSLWNECGYASSSKNGIEWSSIKHNGVAGSTFQDYWGKMHKRRITNYTSSDENKSGYKVMQKITGFYEVSVNSKTGLKNQEKRLNQILETIKGSEYGLIDPLTGDAAVIPLDAPDNRLNYYFSRGVTDPSIVGYDVMAAEEAPLIMTESLLESNLRRFVLDEYAEQGAIPSLGGSFTVVMKMGNTDRVFKKLRDNPGESRTLLNSILEEYSGMETIALDELANTYSAEVPEYGAAGKLEMTHRTISLKDLLALKYENESIKAQLNKWRPPVGGMKRGAEWPLSGAGAYILHITQDPVEILCKTSNRPWSSCESLDSSYRRGAFDDFGVGNAICLVYNASEVMTTEGVLRINRSKALGRFMCRWGMANLKEGGTAPRIGIERKWYRKGSASVNMTRIGSAVITIMTEQNLWDWTKLTSPYNYGGYADSGGGAGGKITLKAKAFSAKVGAETGEVGAVLDYNTRYDMGYGEYRAILEQNDADDVTLNVAENPMVWNYDRVIGLLLSKIYGFYQEESREALIKILIGHDYADIPRLMPALETLDIIQPNYRNLATIDDNLIIQLSRHPRSNAQVHAKLAELMEDDWSKVYASPCSPSLSEYHLPLHEELIFAPESMWIPLIDKLKEVVSGNQGEEIPDSQELTTSEERLLHRIRENRDERDSHEEMMHQLTVEQLKDLLRERGLTVKGVKTELIERLREDESVPEGYNAFGEWYEPILECWAGHYDLAPEILALMRDSNLGVGYWGSLELSFMLMNQPNIGQENFEWLLNYFTTTSLNRFQMGVNENNSDLLMQNRLADKMNGVINLLSYNFNRSEYMGWRLYGGGCPQVSRQKNYIPRTNTTLMNMLAYLMTYYRADELRGSSLPEESEGDFQTVMQQQLVERIYTLYSGCKNSQEIKVFYDFISSLGSSDLELQAKLLPMLFLNTAKRDNPKKRGLRLVPLSAIPAIFALLVNNPFGGLYNNALFFNYIEIGNYGDFLLLLENFAGGLSADDIKTVGGKRLPKLPDEIAFNILTNEETLESMDLELVASSLSDNADMFYIMEDIVLSHYLGELYSPEGDKPFVELAPEDFDDYTILTKLSDGLPPILEMVKGFMENPHTPSEIIERIVQKPRLSAVGYRRMFDYYGIAGNLMERNDTHFEENMLPLLAKNPGLSGRLLRYLYQNYPQFRTTLLLNPNIVEARLYPTLCEEYPLEILDNFDISKRAYLRHLRKLLKEMRLTPPSEYTATYESFHNSVRTIMGRDRIYEIAESCVNQVNGIPTLQFLRAGRCRWGTDLPSAGDGPSEQNLSKTGSIIEYPQIPADGKPFVLYRGVHYNPTQLRTALEDMPGVENWDMGERPSVDSVLTGLDILNTLAPVSAPILVMGEQVEEESEHQELLTGLQPSAESVLLNKQDTGRNTSSLMNIFDSEYVVNNNDPYADQGLYRMANLVGLNWDASNGNAIGNGCYRRLHQRLRRDVEREALLDFIKRCPDNTLLDFNGERSRGFITTKIGMDETTLSLESFKDSEAIRQLLIKRVNPEGFGSYEGEWAYTDVPVVGAFMYDFLSHYFQLDRLRYAEVKIVNGEYNLESLCGWIEPEHRTQVVNYDSRGRFNDRYSVFMLDWVFVLTDRDITSFITEEDDVETVSVPTWRLSFRNADLINVFDKILRNPTLNYNDIIDCFGIFMEAVDDESCIIFPQENLTNPNRGLSGLLSNYNTFLNLLSFDGGNINTFNKTYFPLKYAFENKHFLFMLGLLISQFNTSHSAALSYFNYHTTLTKQFKSMIWGDSGNEAGDILIGMLISLDGNLNPEVGYVDFCPNCTQEMATVSLDEEGKWGCDSCEYVDEDYVKPWRAFKRDLKKFFGGKSLYNKYVGELGPWFEKINDYNGARGPGMEVSTKTSDAQMRLISQYLFTAMVEGYIEHINTNASNLTWRNFILLFRLLNFRNEGNDGTQYLQPAQRGTLETLRNNNLPLYVQASRTFTIREGEGEVFIE